MPNGERGDRQPGPDSVSPIEIAAALRGPANKPGTTELKSESGAGVPLQPIDPFLDPLRALPDVRRANEEPPRPPVSGVR